MNYNHFKTKCFLRAHRCEELEDIRAFDEAKAAKKSPVTAYFFPTEKTFFAKLPNIQPCIF